MQVFLLPEFVMLLRCELLCRYKVVIHTSTLPGACTQASATVKMVFKSAVIERDVHADPDDFARGGEAHIVVKCLEQGSIQELWVGHNNEGAPCFQNQLVLLTLCKGLDIGTSIVDRP